MRSLGPAAQLAAGRSRAALVCIALVLLLAGCGGGDDEEPSPVSPETDRGAAERPSTGASEREDAEADGGGDENAPLVRAVRAYIAALNARRGNELCSLFVPGATRGLDLPRKRGTCAGSLAASIGYADPRGFPVWVRTRIRRVGSVDRQGGRGRVTLTVFHRFRDRKTISPEEDVVHLRRAGGRWLIAKPSSTFYRAIGVADVPPDVLAAP
jgi:hypothetical protein